MKIILCNDLDADGKDSYRLLSETLVDMGHEVFVFNAEVNIDTGKRDSERGGTGRRRLRDPQVAAKLVDEAIERLGIKGMVLDLHWFREDDNSHDYGIRMLGEMARRGELETIVVWSRFVTGQEHTLVGLGVPLEHIKGKYICEIGEVTGLFTSTGDTQGSLHQIVSTRDSNGQPDCLPFVWTISPPR